MLMHHNLTPFALSSEKGLSNSGVVSIHDEEEHLRGFIASFSE